MPDEFRSPWRDGGPYITKSGRVLTDADIQALADEEERLHNESQARYAETKAAEAEAYDDSSWPE